jgi:hypothetical protein
VPPPAAEQRRRAGNRQAGAGRIAASDTTIADARACPQLRRGRRARRALGDAPRCISSPARRQRRRLFGELTVRELVVSLEDNAPPPLLGGPARQIQAHRRCGPDARAHALPAQGLTYRQIARWSGATSTIRREAA